MLNDNIGISDGGPIEVSTTGGTTVSGAVCDGISAFPVYLECVVRKLTAADATFSVIDSSMSFVCTDQGRSNEE